MNNRKELLKEAAFNRGAVHGTAGIERILPKRKELHEDYHNGYDEGNHDAKSFGYSKKDRNEIANTYKDTAAVRKHMKEHQLPYWDKK